MGFSCAALHGCLHCSPVACTLSWDCKGCLNMADTWIPLAVIYRPKHGRFAFIQEHSFLREGNLLHLPHGTARAPELLIQASALQCLGLLVMSPLRWRTMLSAVLKSVAANSSGSGLKLRCSGALAVQCPTTAAVATSACETGDPEEHFLEHAVSNTGFHL